MALEAIHKSIEDIPEAYRDLYSERNGQFELTGIAGIKTQADVDRLSVSLQKERDDHKGTKQKFQVWGDLDYEETIGKLDKIPELEAAAKDGGIDEEKMTELVEGRIVSRLAPIERENAQLKTALAERDETILGHVAKDTKRTIQDALRPAMLEAKVLDVAQEDALMLGERLFEIREDDGAVVMRDSVGYTPGITPKDWLGEIQAKRPHWWAPSSGGGAGGGGGGGALGNNPWSAKNWNLTQQGQFAREHGVEKATERAKAAGSHLGATSPPKE